MHDKHAFVPESFYLQGVFSCMNERDISSSDCKHKHILENGAPPDKFVVMYHLSHREFHGFNSRIHVSGLLHIGSWYQRNF